MASTSAGEMMSRRPTKPQARMRSSTLRVARAVIGPELCAVEGEWEVRSGGMVKSDRENVVNVSERETHTHTHSLTHAHRGCAKLDPLTWIERVLLTDNTLRRYGSCPGLASVRALPLQGLEEQHIRLKQETQCWW